ncbi:hypothetical protein EJ05DRAFT_456469 [Pseudovirgaria hyperparasitica]|uniref:DH domain-containing protein n=1 Tax=Pseudovirgaria hyperparasitica TaxID=470096 RepID=A0A6A6VXJ8_9PEZI|nr:uncharacterized protein EJ05DRAFT_456469 [Pseudovirgaria hyperparasitica]KAF2754360.1 hypothetical protein EJ05DRAFT_456469 [Pseudovirgaria hyperparasitica]
MALINPPPPTLSADNLSIFYTTDELLSASPTLVLHGRSATASAIPTNSRIQVHIYSPAGFQSFPRLTVAPSSPLYAAVDCLAREEQGDEICRGLAFSLYKYFSELSDGVKNTWETRANSFGQLPSAPKLFSDAHAAILASRMVKIENPAHVIEDIKQSLAQQTISWIDLDIVVPAGSMRQPPENMRESDLFNASEEDTIDQRYGDIAPCVRLFGQSAFLPTSKLKRAPSRPTNLNRTLAFTKKQKENLRREMIELLDTEESYVSKIYDLLHSVAEDFRQKAKKKSMSSGSPSEQALKGLFPPSLDQILQVNSSFLEVIRNILDATEDEAIHDLENTSDDPDVVSAVDPNGPDVTGAVTLARSLVEWFPRFSDCYTQYIHAHAEFSGFLRIFLSETGSSFSRRVQETGEQRLMSMLIEPVQRLPRYNLYIDNIVKQLPVRHPALKPFLKARDIISEICSRESSGSQQVKIMNNLRRSVASWPVDFQARGRFITAVDVTELAPPYRVKFQGVGADPGIFLLFTDCLVLLRKLSRRNTNARSLIAELEGSSAMEIDSDGRMQPDLVFHEQFSLSELSISEANDGRVLHLQSSRTKPDHEVPRVFSLSMAYEGRAAKFSEEFVKARVEGRFPEAERDSYKWEVRSVPGDLSLFPAISEDLAGHRPSGRRLPAPIRVYIDPSKFSATAKPGDLGIEVVCRLSILGENFYLLDITGTNDYASRDRLSSTEFMPVFTKRLSNFFQLRNQIRNPAMTSLFLMRNQQILSSLNVILPGVDPEPSGDKTFRSASPVKMLSSFFSGTSKDSNSFRKQRPMSTLGDAPRLLAPSSSRPQSRDRPLSRDRPESRDSESTSRPQSAGVGTVSSTPTRTAESMSKLEDTLCAYLLALHSRKGNVVGKNIRNRATADELVVNELYNALLEDPANHQAAAHASVDVVFSAFEKFVKIAWKEKMGPVVAGPILIAFQSKSDSSYPGEFESYFRQIFSDMSPPNQRALQSIVKLLADLLEGTGNDGDRGILTASFAEILVTDGNANDFISLLDRFVEDIYLLFAPEPSTPLHSSISSETRIRLAHTGSLSSNASSLRKKFGLGGLTRENSKSDLESKFGSVFRTLSKTARGESSRNDQTQPAGMSRASLVRSRSTDTDARVSPKRPVSRDRPTVLGAFAFEDDTSHSGRSFLGVSGLDTIGEVPSAHKHPRKKRRSSLSDLKPLQCPAPGTPTWSPQTPRRPTHVRQTSASPSTPTRTPKTSHIPEPVPTPLTRSSSPTKENGPPRTHRGHSPLKTPIPAATSDVTIISRGPSKRRSDSVSGIPMLKTSSTAPPILSERPSSGNTPKVSSTTKVPTATGRKPPLSSSPPKKLRMQSPQKLRERLQKEQNAIATSSPMLQAELCKIGDEIAAQASLRSASPVRASRSNTVHSSSSKSSSLTPSIASMGPLIGRVTTLESRLSTLISETESRTKAIGADLSSSLQVSETKARKLDELYREANAENEALYAKFNDELIKVVRNVRGGDGVEELKRLLKASQEEVAVLKRESSRLKRENVGLRAQLRE